MPVEVLVCDEAGLVEHEEHAVGIDEAQVRHKQSDV